ncbi:MAG: cyclophilin-like fold protein [Erysipelotrichaceae bacterium]|nr:cyclophilin-like fold protein [Erysipelotrichaceae bacterium]
MNKLLKTAMAMLLFTGITGCASKEETVNEPEEIIQNENSESDQEMTEEKAEEKENTAMIMRINDEIIETVWENNESVRELEQLVSDKPLVIEMSMYGGWEQVGGIGRRIVRNDVQTTAVSGDIMLYSGDQIVLFYGSNSWAYTKLGVMQATDDELRNLLGNGNVTLTLSME